MKSKLKNFFYPKTICIAGASSKEKSIGYELLKCVKDFNFSGKVFPVNPNSDEILGFKTYSSILEIFDEIDLGIVLVPKKFIEQTIEDFVSKKTKSLIIITAGFKEIGKTGEELEIKIKKKLNENGIRFVGPNCMGVINTSPEIKLNATFVAEKPETGGIAFLSQSGALGAAVLNSLRQTNIRFNHFISVGNKADLNENDFLQFWQDDSSIKAITMYLESFENGFDFLKLFMEEKISKPVIILKAGRTKSGIKAASSHTGAISSKDEIIDNLLNQFGIIRVENLNELFNTAKGFEYFPLPKGNKIAVITNAGGPAILAVDKLDKEKLKLAELSFATKEKLRIIVHPEGSINNPIDLLPGGSAEIYKKAIEILLDDENVDSVISIFVEPVMVSPIPVIDAVNSVISPKPVFQVVMPLPEFWSNYNHSKPVFKNPEDPAEILSNMLLFKNKINSRKEKFYPQLLNIKSKTIDGKSGEFLPSESVSELLQNYKIPIAMETFINSASDIDFIDDKFFPCVAKGISALATHKSELKAVKIDIKSKMELKAALDEISLNMREKGIEAEKFLIQNFIKAKHEILIGGFRDKSFGGIVTFGSGGKYVEFVNDKSMRSIYSAPQDIEEMVGETNIGKILAGVRGEAGIDIKKLIDIISSFNLLMIENKNISEVDINPLIISEENKFYAVDTRIKLI